MRKIGKVVKLKKVDIDNETIEMEDVEMNIKPKWSLKKKLMIGGGVLAGLALGALALGNKKNDTIDTDIVDDSYEDSCDDDIDDTDDDNDSSSDN